MTLRLAEEEEEHVPLFMTEIDTASYRGITTRDIELLQRELSSYYNAQTHGEQLNLLQARMQGMKVKDDSKHLDVLAIIVYIHQVHLL